jgi:Spy/CpxP family protein refolding chaperone
MSVSAQEKRDVTTNKKDKIERSHRKGGMEMMKDLNLSDAQKAQLKSIREDKSLSQEEKKAKMNSVFTVEQRNILAQKRAGMDDKRQEMGAKRDQEWQSKLGLSNDQAARLKAINEENHAKMKALKDNQTLSAEAKKTQMKALQESAREQRKAILTAEQIKKMDSFKKEGRGRNHKEKEDK